MHFQKYNQTYLKNIFQILFIGLQKDLFQIKFLTNDAQERYL